MCGRTSWRSPELPPVTSASRRWKRTCDHALFGAYAQRGGDLRLMAEIAERGLRSAEAAGLAGQRVALLSQVTWLATRQSDLDKTVRLSREMLEVIDTDPELEAMRPKALDHLASALAELDRTHEVLPLRRKVCRLSPPGSRVLAIRLVLLAETLFEDDRGLPHLGELDDVLTEAREIVERLGDELGRAHVDVYQARARILAGDLGAGADLLDRRSRHLRGQPGRVGRRAGPGRSGVAGGGSRQARDGPPDARGGTPGVRRGRRPERHRRVPAPAGLTWLRGCRRRVTTGGSRFSHRAGSGVRRHAFRMVVDSTPCVTIWHKMATDGAVPTRFAKDWLLTVTVGEQMFRSGTRSGNDLCTGAGHRWFGVTVSGRLARG